MLEDALANADSVLHQEMQAFHDTLTSTKQKAFLSDYMRTSPVIVRHMSESDIEELSLYMTRVRTSLHENQPNAAFAIYRDMFYDVRNRVISRLEEELG